jgi:hypothetical protein
LGRSPAYRDRGIRVGQLFDQYLVVPLRYGPAFRHLRGRRRQIHVRPQSRSCRHGVRSSACDLRINREGPSGYVVRDGGQPRRIDEVDRVVRGVGVCRCTHPAARNLSSEARILQHRLGLEVPPEVRRVPAVMVLVGIRLRQEQRDGRRAHRSRSQGRPVGRGALKGHPHFSQSLASGPVSSTRDERTIVPSLQT